MPTWLGEAIRNVLYWGWVGFLLIIGVRYVLKKDNWFHYYRNIMWHLYLTIIPLIATIIALGLYLTHLNSAIFGFSWLPLIAHLLGGNAQATNINLAGITIPFLGVLLCLLLYVQLPSMARMEEELFRKRTRSWPQGLMRSLLFGLSHMIVGVPFGFALCLSLGGIYFTHLYFKGGVKLSTQGHFQYNLVPITLLMLISVVITIRVIV